MSSAATAGPSLAVLGAFAFPCPQGSQVFARDQARALARAGARPVLLTYGSGDPHGDAGDLRVLRTPARLSPAGSRSGPRWSKPLADLALLALLRRFQSRERPDVVWAHNVEAAAVGLAARALSGTPVVYVAHTLLGEELSAYGPPRARPALDRTGRAVDRALARAADGVLALCPRAGAALEAAGAREVRVLPPGLDPGPPPHPGLVDEACARAGVRKGAFALYAGNLDGYQGLELLAPAARRLAERDIPLVASTHDTRRLAAPVRTLTGTDPARLRDLAHGAGVLLLPRRRVGGYPIKLLNYLETGRPVVAFEGVAEGLSHGREAWLLPRDAGARDLADAVATLLGDPQRAHALGAAGRRHLDTHHRWSTLARDTLAWLQGLLAGGRERARLSAPAAGG